MREAHRIAVLAARTFEAGEPNYRVIHALAAALTEAAQEADAPADFRPFVAPTARCAAQAAAELGDFVDSYCHIAPAIGEPCERFTIRVESE